MLAPELKGSSFVDIVDRLQFEGHLPTLRNKLVLGPDRAGAGSMSWYDLQWAGEGAGLAEELSRRKQLLSPGQPINIQFTSGTTGVCFPGLTMRPPPVLKSSAGLNSLSCSQAFQRPQLCLIETFSTTDSS